METVLIVTTSQALVLREIGHVHFGYEAAIEYSYGFSWG